MGPEHDAAAATALRALGARPVLCELDPQQGSVDLVDARRRLTPRSRAVLVGHPHDAVGEVMAARRFAQRYSLALIEDTDRAHAATHPDGPAGSFGDLVILSLADTALAPAAGGGMLLARRRATYERAMLFSRVNGRVGDLTDPQLRDLRDTGLGQKLRMHPLAAVAGLVGWQLWQQNVAARRAAAQHLSGLLDGAELRLRWQPRSAYRRYIVEAPIGAGERVDRLLAAARRSGLPVSRAGRPPRGEDFPRTHQHVSRLLEIPAMVGADRCADRESFIAYLVGLWKATA
jgi:dTDP-4-amino-4,6-dideoxygalactose transaminase